MYYTPTSYQDEDSDAILDYNHALIWNDPGTGKTLTAMEAYRKGEYEKIVVLAPKIALSMWADELRKHLGLKYYVLRSGKIPRKFWGLHVDAIITTHDLAAKHRDLVRKFLSKNGKVDRPTSVLVIDEAHYYKNLSAKRTQAVMGPQGRGVGGLFAMFDDVWQLTGTPMTNYADDLYSQLAPARGHILDYYHVGTHSKWVREFCETKQVRYSKAGPLHTRVCGNKNVHKLEKILAACGVIRRKLSDVEGDMPPLTISIQEINLSRPVRDMTMEEHANLEKLLSNPDSAISKVRRAIGEAKVKDLVEFLKTVRKPCLVGLWHRDVIDQVYESLTQLGYTVEMVTGDTSPRGREIIKDRFNSGDLQFIIGQMRAMAESWNLQETARNVVIGEEVPSPALLDQFIARVYRKGQKKSVHVDIMHSPHSLDEALAYVREKKQTTIQRAI